MHVGTLLRPVRMESAQRCFLLQVALLGFPRVPKGAFGFPRVPLVTLGVVLLPGRRALHASPLFTGVMALPRQPLFGIDDDRLARPYARDLDRLTLTVAHLRRPSLNVPSDNVPADLVLEDVVSSAIDPLRDGATFSADGSAHLFTLHGKDCSCAQFLDNADEIMMSIEGPSEEPLENVSSCGTSPPTLESVGCHLSSIF